MKKSVIAIIGAAIVLLAQLPVSASQPNPAVETDSAAVQAATQSLYTAQWTQAHQGSGRLQGLNAGNLSMENGVYVGGTYRVRYRYENGANPVMRYRLADGSAGQIELDEATGIFTITKAGDFTLEAWAQGCSFASGRMNVTGVKLRGPNPAPQPSRQPTTAGSGSGDSRSSSGSSRSSSRSGGSSGSSSRQDVYAYAQQVVDLTNKERDSRGLYELEMDSELMEAAMLRAEEIATDFSHTRPNGESASRWAMEVMGSNYGAENIAKGYSSPSAAVRGWINSSGHYRNMMSEKADYIGVGCYQDDSGTLYWVQLFSS